MYGRGLEGTHGVTGFHRMKDKESYYFMNNIHKEIQRKIVNPTLHPSIYNIKSNIDFNYNKKYNESALTKGTQIYSEALGAGTIRKIDNDILTVIFDRDNSIRNFNKHSFLRYNQVI